MVGERYTLSNLQKAVKDPRQFYKEPYRVFNSIARRFNNYRYDVDGIDVMAKDWDNLYILDACRYDLFVEENFLDGDLRAVHSRGSHSRTFMEKNFVGKELHDTVYVTANLHAEFLDQDTFYTVEIIPYSDRNPERVEQMALEMHDKYPDKRLIVHYMQPHKPYLGPTGERVRERLQRQGRDDLLERGNYIKWDAVREGEMSREELQQAYRENINIGLSSVENLLEAISGKSVVTADHGELLGASLFSFTRPIFGHPEDVLTEDLRKIPWLVIDSETRRDISAGRPVGFDKLDSDLANDRLRELGYVQ